MFRYRRSSIALLAAGVALVACSSARAQALWTLTLDNPDQTVVAGTAGTLVFTGSIQNTDPAQALNLLGDAFTTGVWDVTLTLMEDPAFTAFLTSPGAVDAGMSYTGPLFDLTYTASTPPATAPPYDGSFRVDTDGTPNSLAAAFTLAVQPAGGGAVPEPGTLA